MIITLVAVLCQISSNACVEELIPGAPSLTACLINGEQVLADRMKQSETYSSGWRVEQFKCAIGEYRKSQAL